MVGVEKYRVYYGHVTTFDRLARPNVHEGPELPDFDRHMQVFAFLLFHFSQKLFVLVEFLCYPFFLRIDTGREPVDQIVRADDLSRLIFCAHK